MAVLRSGLHLVLLISDSILWRLFLGRRYFGDEFGHLYLRRHIFLDLTMTLFVSPFHSTLLKFSSGRGFFSNGSFGLCIALLISIPPVVRGCSLLISALLVAIDLLDLGFDVFNLTVGISCS